MGAQVTVIEDAEVGGTCLNRGCIPTKSIIASTEMLSKIKESGNLGIEIKGNIIPNLAKIIERKNKIVSIQVKGIRNLFKSWGITLKEGRGILLSPRDIEITLKDTSKEIVTSDKIILATGSRPSRVPAFPFDGERIISSDEAVNIKEIPKSLLVVGAGVIGCEFACIYKDLGSEVTIAEMLPRAISTENTEISELLEREFKKKKIQLLTSVKIEKLDIKGDGIHTLLSNGKKIVTEKVLVSIGRTLNSDGIGLETTGINKGNHGQITVNEKMETNVPGVYAVGDVTGSLLLAHVASKEGIIAVRNAMGGDEKIDYNVVPTGIFTSPEIGSVGLREYQASEQGIKVKTGHFQFRAPGKAHAMGETTGFFKIVSEDASDRILGVHIIGPHASDLIHEAAVAIRNGLKTKDIAKTIHAHPTLSEGLMEAAEDVHGEVIHVLKR
jgi:dihydrolipoamide dehydrogenase